MSDLFGIRPLFCGVAGMNWFGRDRIPVFCPEMAVFAVFLHSLLYIDGKIR